MGPSKRVESPYGCGLKKFHFVLNLCNENEAGSRGRRVIPPTEVLSYRFPGHPSLSGSRKPGHGGLKVPGSRRSGKEVPGSEVGALFPRGRVKEVS